MSGEKSGVWKCMRCVVLNALYNIVPVINSNKLLFIANEHMK